MPAPGGLPFPAQASAPEFDGGEVQLARRAVHDVVEPGQALVEMRAGHEDDHSSHRVQAHPAEPAGPVQAGEGGHRRRVRPEW